MAQRVSVLRQLSHMASLAQNQNQSHKTISKAGEDVQVAGGRMTTLNHWELDWPDGAERARQEFHRRKMDFAPFYLSRLISLIAMLHHLLSFPWFILTSRCLWLCRSLSRLCSSLAPSESWPSCLPYSAFILRPWPSSFFLSPSSSTLLFISPSYSKFGSTITSPESLFWSLIQFTRPFSGFLESLCAYFMNIHPTVQ